MRPNLRLRAPARRLLYSTCTLVLCCLVVTPAHAIQLTLEKARAMARGQTARGSIIDGQLEVAKRTYEAKRTNFYFPEISINGQLPSYNLDQSYRNIFGLSQRTQAKSTDLGLQSFIQAEQSLITGGDFSISANLTRNDEKYPQVNQSGSLVDIQEISRQAFLQFSLTQPLLKPSDAKHDLHNKEDDYSLARLQQQENVAALDKEVIEAYMGVLRLSLAQSLAEDKMEAARVKAEVDSAKFSDGVVSEEEYLTSVSERLDAELGLFEAKTDADEKRRELAMLLDLDPTAAMETSVPEVNGSYDAAEANEFINRWENSLAVERSRLTYEKAARQANYEASSHGLNGDLSVNYSLGRGTIDKEAAENVDINTNRWEVAVNFSYPIWDGGASRSAIQAARLSAEQSRLEYLEAERSAKGQIINLVNRLDVSYRRLEVIRQQVSLSENRLNIAESRYNDGQISRLTYLESRISYLETRDKYLAELKNFLLNQVDLESSLIG